MNYNKQNNRRGTIYTINNVLDEKIYSASISKEKNQIYICLLNNKIVLIFDYNLKKKILN